MGKEKFYRTLSAELDRIDAAKTSKRFEHLIERFTDEENPKAIIGGKRYSVFNSNDYLGFRHHPAIKKAEHDAVERLGTGPGAVRFISGSFAKHRELEKALAAFHRKDDAIVLSAAFASNIAALFSLSRKQAKDSLLTTNVCVISDELNHRSIIDGVRIANLPKEDKRIFKHRDVDSLEAEIRSCVGKYDRLMIVTDGVFSMLGAYQDLNAVRKLIDRYDDAFPEGILLLVDDCHGVAAFGESGRGTEEVCGAGADVLIGTLGKGFGADGGYIAAGQVVVDYLREAAATYIYSNSIAPGTAAAALEAVRILDSAEGARMLAALRANIAFFKKAIAEAGFTLAADSIHPIQPVLFGTAEKTKRMVQGMFAAGYLLSAINYPVVPKDRDEIRVQLSAAQTEAELREFVGAFRRVAIENGALG